MKSPRPAPESSTELPRTRLESTRHSSYHWAESPAFEWVPFSSTRPPTIVPIDSSATQGNIYGSGNFGEIGAGVSLLHDSRDRRTAATRGLLLEVGGNLYPGVWDVDSTFGEVEAVAATYLTAHVPLEPHSRFGSAERSSGATTHFSNLRSSEDLPR